MKEFYLCTQPLGAPLKGDGCVQMKSNLKHNACHEIVTRREEEVQRNAIFYQIFSLKSHKVQSSKVYDSSVKIFN